MDERRALLKELANSSVGSWAAAHRPAVFDGSTRVETRNTVYQFLDGVCFAVSRRDASASAPDTNSTTSDFVGMRIVGFLIHGGDQPTVVQAWRPGAYAVLWRQSALGESSSTFALTSQTTGFVPCIQPPVMAKAAKSSGLTGGVWAKTPPSYGAATPAASASAPSAPASRVELKLPTPAQFVAGVKVASPRRPTPTPARPPSVPPTRAPMVTPVAQMAIPRAALPTNPAKPNPSLVATRHVPVAGPRAVVPAVVVKASNPPPLPSRALASPHAALPVPVAIASAPASRPAPPRPRPRTPPPVSPMRATHPSAATI